MAASLTCTPVFIRGYILISASKKSHTPIGHSQKPLNYYVCVQRNYDVSLPHNKIPEALCELAKQLAKPALPTGVEFRPEAAIVNYFGLGMLKENIYYEPSCVIVPCVLFYSLLVEF